MYGGGFIVEASRLRGVGELLDQVEEGKVIKPSTWSSRAPRAHRLSNVQFFLKVLDDNTIAREFPGMEGMEVTYHRCQI